MSPTDFVVRKAAADERFERARKLDDVVEERVASPSKAARFSLSIVTRRMTQRWSARLKPSNVLARGPQSGCPRRSKQMFGNNDLVDNLSRDLKYARVKRDTLASDVTTLTAQIAELETRLSVEKDRRERERAAGEINEIKKRLEDTALALAPGIAGLCDATERAAAIVPEARELNSSLMAMARDVDTGIPSVLGELLRLAEAVRAGHVAPVLPQPPEETPQPPENHDGPLRLPAFLPRKKETEQSRTAESQRSTAA